MLLDVVAAKKWKRVEDFNNSLDRRMRKKLKPSNDFPFIVSKECRQSRIVKFIDATGSNALAISVCTVCAGSFFASEVREVLVSQLQEKKLLRPFRTHPACHDPSHGGSYMAEGAFFIRVGLPPRVVPGDFLNLSLYGLI